MTSDQRADNAKRPDKSQPDDSASDKHFDEEHATRKSGRWGADEPDYGDREPARDLDSKKPNPHGPEYEQGAAYPGPTKDNNPGGSPESMRNPDSLGKANQSGTGEQNPQERTAGNHPADPNRMGADWNLLPPGISDDDVKDPGNMDDKRKEK